MSSSQEYTPMRGVDDKQPSETGIKEERQSEVHEERDLGQELRGIEQRIHDTENSLREINRRKLGVDERSEEYGRLEEERRVLRHQLVDLDYEHKQAYKRYKLDNIERERQLLQASERKLREQREERLRQLQRIDQERLERSRRAVEQLEQLEREAREKRQQALRQAEGGQAEPKPTGEASEQATPEQRLAKSRHQARVAQIQAELASDRLRRSRQIQLQGQLIRLRASRPLVSSLYSYYPLYRYPYYLDPIYSPLSYPRYSLLYPSLYPYI